MKKITALWVLVFILACYPIITFVYQLGYPAASPTAIIYIIDSAKQSTLKRDGKNVAIEVKYSELLDALAALEHLQKSQLKK